MKIKVYIKNKGMEDSGYLPEIIDKGDWIDLTVPYDVSFNAPSVIQKKDKATGKWEKERWVKFDSKLIDFNIAMKLPAGFEAHVLPRSSTYLKYGVILCNSHGIIDNSYSGNDDTWKFGAIALRESKIKRGKRIAQFRIQLSQRATFWQKLKWLLSSKIKLVEVDDLCSKSRGGIGSTGE